jgi:methylmalonyl-CoA mutase
MVRNTYIYPPEPIDAHHRATSSRYTAQQMPKFNSIIDLRLPHAGGGRDSQALELAFTLADGMEYVQDRRWPQGLDVDELRRPPVLLLGDRHELLHGDRQDARGAPAVVRAS